MPTHAEWTELENYLIANGYNYDGTTTENKLAKSLATSAGWAFDSTPGSIGNTDFPEKRNATGFSALPSAFRSDNASFASLGYGTFWWSATDYSSTHPWYRYLVWNSRKLIHGNISIKDFGFSVRCLKD